MDKVYRMSLVLYRAQFADLDNVILEAHRKAQQRLCSAPWMAYPPVLLEGLRGLGFASRAQDLRPAAHAARIRSVATSRVFDSCLADADAYMSSEEALLVHRLRAWLDKSILMASRALWNSHRGDPNLEAALLRPRPQAELTNILEARRASPEAACAVIRRRVARWVEADATEAVVAALLPFFRRSDVPDAVKHTVLRTAANAWCTSRRFQADVGSCVYGCGAQRSDMLEHYLFCPEVYATALRHLRLDLEAVRGGGVGRLLVHLGLPGERGMRLALHLDAALAAYNRVSHNMGGTGLQAYAARLKEGARRFDAVARTLRLCAAARSEGVPRD